MTIRCSNLSRVMSCAGSLFFTNPPEDKTGEPARQGTAAGEYLQHLLERRPITTTQATNGFPFDDDMRFFTTPISQELFTRAGSNPIVCEQRIDWVTRSGIVIRGQYDSCFESQELDGETLNIDDLKYGWKIVNVFENWQLLGYAIGECLRKQKSYKKIKLTIQQPRAHHVDGPVREWILTFEELMEYKERIEKRMELIASGFKELQTGKQCKYCPFAAEHCVAFNELFYDMMQVTHEHDEDSLSDKQLVEELDKVNLAYEVLKIKKDSIDELAKDRIKAGRVVPGYDLKKSFGNRTWKGGVTAATLKALTGRDVETLKILSPAQAEAIGVSKKITNALTEKFFKGVNLVRNDVGEQADLTFGSEPPVKII